jgi:NAD(P)-dependent dehydrogenase (short-subunit alcohol dehydrogenase family)
MGPAERILEVNALGTVHVERAFHRFARDGFCLVNVASSAGHLPRAVPPSARTYELALTDPDRFLRRLDGRCELVPRRLRPGMAYALSKHFVIWFSRRMAAELGRRGARVLSVSPGSFDTEMGRLEDAGGAGELARRSSLGRYGRVAEIAELLAFVAGARAGYLTGTDILVDGGARAAMTLRDALAMARSR